MTSDELTPDAQTPDEFMPDEFTPDAQTPDEFTPAQVEEELRTEILRVHEESYGTGATHVTIMVEDNVVLIVLDVVLTRAEQTLLDAGRDDAVKQTREEYQKAIGPTFIAIVEHATGRRVTSFLSAMNVEPLYSIEFFRLAASPD